MPLRRVDLILMIINFNGTPDFDHNLVRSWTECNEALRNVVWNVRIENSNLRHQNNNYTGKVLLSSMNRFFCRHLATKQMNAVIKMMLFFAQNKLNYVVVMLAVTSMVNATQNATTLISNSEWYCREKQIRWMNWS